MTDNLVVEYIRCKCTRYWYLDWNKKYHRKSLESFEEEVNGSGSRAWQCWHRLYLVPLQITLRHCLLHSARWLLPACPKTVESKQPWAPNKKHQRRNLFSPQEQLSDQDSRKLMWKYLSSLSSSNFGSDEESVLYYSQHFEEGCVHGVPRVGHDWATSLSLFTFMHWRRKWPPIPVFLPGESQGRGSLVGCHLWCHTESDTTEAT